jgi:hypothetical protein
VDFMEGLFLGPLWSDTDFENRRHVTLYMLYGMAVCGLIAFSFFTGSFSSLLGENRVVKLVMILFLFLACPFLCFRYYRYPIWIKIPILAVQAGKIALLTLFMTTWVMPYMNISSNELQTNMIGFLNSTLESTTKQFAGSAGTFSTVIGVITGGIYVVFLFAVFVILAILIPGMIFLLFRIAQYGYDKIISKLILINISDR